MAFPHPKREEIVDFLKNLREEMIYAFEQFEEVHFIKTPWDYTYEGGGEIGLIRGKHFEKAAINWSGVSGPNFPFNDQQGPFFATGISLISHMYNPHAPTAHFNLRFIETAEKFWFGGGYDLTPMGFLYPEDTEFFHHITQQALENHPGLYEEFSKNAKEYFYIPHRKKERGVGGLFFDHLNTMDFENDYRLWKIIGNTFLKALLPIYHKRIHQPFTEEEKDFQLHQRSHYVEFNLLYDRGTKFGFQSGGNPEAILCSLPPLVKW